MHIDGLQHAPQELQPLVLRQEVRDGSWRAAAASEEHLSALRLLQVTGCHTDLCKLSIAGKGIAMEAMCA
jgi:hypothetical protein